MFLILLTIASIAVLIIFCWLSTWTAQPNYDLSQSSILIYTLRILSGEVNTISTQHSPRNESTAVLPSLLSEEASEYLNNLEEPNNQESIPIDRSTIMSHYDVVDESNHESLTEINPTVTNDCLTESCCPQQQSNDNNSINVYFRMLNESQKVVHARPTQTIGELKRLHFDQELNANQLVRFIFRGRLLRDNETLRSCNITDNTTVHCFITAQTNNSTEDNRHINADDLHSNGILFGNFDPSQWFVPMVTVALIGIWLLRLKFRRIFSPTSTILLFFLSFLYATGIASLACQHFSRSTNIVGHSS